MSRASVRRIVCLVMSVSAIGLATSALAQQPAEPDGWVVIPVDDYRALRLKAFPPDRPPDPPPNGSQPLAAEEFHQCRDRDPAPQASRLAPPWINTKHTRRSRLRASRRL